MGASFTAPPDRTAGRDVGWRTLSLCEADEARSARLVRLILMVRRLRNALYGEHGPWSPLHSQVDALEEAIIALEVDADHVRIRVSPSEGD